MQNMFSYNVFVEIICSTEVNCDINIVLEKFRFNLMLIKCTKLNYNK